MIHAALWAALLQGALPMPQPQTVEPPRPLWYSGVVLEKPSCVAGWIVGLRNEPGHTETTFEIDRDGYVKSITVPESRCWMVRVCDELHDPQWYAVPRDQWLKLRLGDWWDSRHEPAPKKR